jgi:glycosyltransferase involved in cell wall biosynthesis
MITSASFPPEEGVGNYIYNLSKELIKRGHYVTVITRGGFGKTVKNNFEGIEVYKTPFIPLYPFHVHIHGLSSNNLFRNVESQFDIIHYHTPLPPLVKTKLPIVTTMHSSVKKSVEMDQTPLTVRLQSKLSYNIERNVLKSSKKITCVSRSIANELVDYGLNPNSISIIGNGVDETLFRPSGNKRGKPYILFTGRITYQKGAHDFIECAKMICSKRDDINFKLAGKGPLADKLKKVVAGSGYSDRFEFLNHIGHSDKLRLVDVYQNATIFVLPSHYEGLPTTLLEAMACEIPVIATKINAIADVIEPGKNGILVSVRSPDKMAYAISILLDNDKIRDRLGKAARRTVVDNYTLNKMYTNIIKCYESL